MKGGLPLQQGTIVYNCSVIKILLIKVSLTTYFQVFLVTLFIKFSTSLNLGIANNRKFAFCYIDCIIIISWSEMAHEFSDITLQNGDVQIILA